MHLSLLIRNLFLLERRTQKAKEETEYTRYTRSLWGTVSGGIPKDAEQKGVWAQMKIKYRDV